jgi:hypothetical protein
MEPAHSEWQCGGIVHAHPDDNGEATDLHHVSGEVNCPAIYRFKAERIVK